MNPLTLVKRIQKLNSREADLGISEDASWHAKYRDSAYVFVSGIPYDLTEGDLLAIFAQCGEVVDVNLVRDKASGKSKGFAFIANLAVDNLNAAQILGRTVRVDHVSKYKKREEDEETERQMREERGVCRAFQIGECTRGAGCKFSHDEQRAANTGWGHEEDMRSKWRHDKFQGGGKPEKKPVDREPESGASIRRKAGDFDAGRPRRGDDEIYHKADGVDAGRSGRRGHESYRKADELDAGRSRRDDESYRKHNESDFKDRDGRERSRQLHVKEKGGHKEDRGAYESSTSDAGEDYDYERREEKRPRQEDTKEYRARENRDKRERGKDRDQQRDRERKVRSRDRDDHHISQR